MNRIFGVASIPRREKNLKATLNSVLPQADRVHVYLNNYQFTPEFLQHDKIFVYRSQEHGDRSDAGKFWNVPKDCKYFSIDDDIIYPPSYADYLESKLDEYYGQVIVSLHGRLLRPTPLKSYYKGKYFIHHCKSNQPKDRFVHIGGTGVMAFDTNHFRPTPDLFRVPHMADIWIGRLSQTMKMPILAVAHQAGYIRPQDNIGPTIFNRHINNDAPQTRVVNEISWTLYKAEL